MAVAAVNALASEAETWLRAAHFTASVSAQETLS